MNFGEVIKNEILSKEIKVNPEAKFYTFHKINGKEVREQYEPENISEYLSSPNYEGAYNEIKRVFGMENTIYIGFGNVSDAYYLFESNKRYDLKDFSYNFIDLKDIFTWKYGNKISKTYRGLEGIARFFNIKWQQKHNALDDSIMTLKICEKLVEKCKGDILTISELSNALYIAKESKVYKNNVLINKIIYPDMKLPD